MKSNTQQPTKVICALYTIIAGRKNYVAKQYRPTIAGQKPFFDYTHDPGNAKDFISEKLAWEAATGIANPAGREYRPEFVEVPDMDAVPVPEVAEAS